MAKHRIKKILRTLVFTLSAIVGFFALAIGGIALYLNSNKKEIKQIVVNEINGYLLAPVSVESIDVSLFHRFPLVSVTFEGVKAQAVRPEDKEDVLSVDGINLTFSLFDVLQKNYEVHEIIVRGGEFNLKHYGGGAFNYEIWKKNPHPERQNLRFSLRRVLLRNTLIRWRDMVGNHEYQILVRNASARGDLDDSGQDFGLRGDVSLHKIQVSGKTLLEDRKASVDLDVANRRGERDFLIRKGHLNIEGLNFGVTGSVHYVKTEAWLTYDIIGNKLKVNRLAAMLPKHIRKSLSDYTFKGTADFHLKISGDYTTSFLNLQAGFDYAHGSVVQKSSGISADNVAVKGVYTNGVKKCPESSSLRLNTLKASLPGGYIDGSFLLDNFVRPEISFEGLLEADLARLQTFLKVLPQIALRGDVSADLSFKNRFPNLQPKLWGKDDVGGAEIEGRLRAGQIVSDLGDNKVVAIDSLCGGFDSRAFKTDLFTLSYGGEQAAISFQSDNLLSYVFFSDNNLDINGLLRSRRLTVEKWIELADAVSGALARGRSDTASAARDRRAGEREGKREGKKLDGNFEVDMDVDKLTYDNFVLTHTRGKLLYSPGHIRLERVSFGSFGGELKGDVTLTREDKTWNVLLEGNLRQLDISSCFKAFNNFNQKQITHENIGGKLSADFRFRGVYDESAHRWPLDAVALTSVLTIRDGRLRGMESLRKVSRLTGENDLQDIHFKDLTTCVEIYDECIRIHRMNVVSDALNLSVEGTHTFHNEVDYLLNIELSDLLSRNRSARRAGKSEDFGVEIDDNGRVRLPITITGVLPDVSVKYALKEAVKGAKERLRDNRREFKEELDKEFEESRRRRMERKEEKDLMKRRENGEFIIEIEEDMLEPASPTEPAELTEPAERPRTSPEKGGTKPKEAKEPKKEKNEKSGLEGFKIEIEDE